MIYAQFKVVNYTVYLQISTMMHRAYVKKKITQPAFSGPIIALNGADFNGSTKRGSLDEKSHLH